MLRLLNCQTSASSGRILVYQDGHATFAKRQAAMTANIARDWIGILAFFPLWAVTTIICFALIAGPKKIAGIRTQKFLNASALVLSLSSATAILIGLDC